MRNRIQQDAPDTRRLSSRGRTSLSASLRAFARQLRKNQSDAEGRLWSLLRNRQVGGFKFRRQQPMAPYVLDFYCHEARLAIELDGGQHGEPGQLARDEKRTRDLAERGISVLRFPKHVVLRDVDVVLDAIHEALKNPHPTPLPKGEGADPPLGAGGQ